MNLDDLAADMWAGAVLRRLYGGATMPWDESRLAAVEQSAVSCPDACAADVRSLIAEVRRLRGERVAAFKLIDCAWSAQCGECLNAAHALLEN